MDPLRVRVTLTFDVVPDEALPVTRRIADAVVRAIRVIDLRTIEGVAMTHVEMGSSS